MSRIFVSLASLNILAQLVTYALGLGLHQAHQAGTPAVNGYFQAHFFTGLFTALLTLLVHCIIFTYFLGTGRWVKETALAYHLPDWMYAETKAYKRRTFPSALWSMVLIILTVLFGAAADARGWSIYYHLALASLAVLFNVSACRVEYLNVRANMVLLDQVVQEVRRIQATAAMDPNRDPAGAHSAE